MKKFLALLATAALTVSTLAACGTTEPAEDTGSEGGESTEVTPSVTNPRDSREGSENTLVVGNTEFNGQFITGFGNSSYDKQIRDLTTGYGTVSVTFGGEFVINETAIKEYTTSKDEETGNVTYTFTVNEGLKFSDGEPVMASDYVFAAKLLSSASYAAVGASNANYMELIGYQAWADGEADDFEGVKLVDDYTFSLTISGEELPYFYQLSLVSVAPYPEHFYTNGGAVGFDLEKDADGNVTNEHVGKYVKEELLSNPTVGSGPYRFVEYRPGEFVKLELNENFAGDYRGNKPSIQNVVVKVVPSQTDMEHLVSGEIDILTGVVEGEKIEQGKADENINPVTYKRNGYGMLAFHTDMPIISDKRVRQAVAYLVDRTTFVGAFLQGYGAVVDGPYGLGQWMLEDSSVVPESLTSYAFDPEKAAALLDEAGWGFDAAGEAYSGDGYRYSADGEILQLNWMATETEYSDLLLPILRKGFSEAGIKLTIDFTDFGTLLDKYYYVKKEDVPNREYHMFNLATSFSAAYDPYYSYHSDFMDTWMNSNQFENPRIDELTLLMRELEPTQREEFLGYWEEFITIMNDELPNLPLYSNEYYHFNNAKIEGFESSAFWDWTASIVDMKIAD
jgi:peptide/nickel transport system substrate-binding protein